MAAEEPESTVSRKNTCTGTGISTDNQVSTDTMDKNTLFAVISFLKKNNFKETEELLRKEANVGSEEVGTKDCPAIEADVSQALDVYRSDDDPAVYEDSYSSLKAFIENCLDIHKVELNTLLYPVFVHMYLELIYNRYPAAAKSFYEKFSDDQEHFYRRDLSVLFSLTTPEQMSSNQLMENFRSSKFVIRMSRDSYNHLKRYLQERRLKTLLTLVQDNLFIDVYDGIPRNQEQVAASVGGLLGEASKEANSVKVFYGLLKEPELNIPLDDDEEPESEDKPKKRKSKKDLQIMKKSKTDPHAPSTTRIPLPELQDHDKAEKIAAYKESLKCTKVDVNHLPSILFYTLYNANQGVTSVDISHNSSLLCTGFADSTVKLWSLTPSKLKAMKSPSDLDLIDKDMDDVLEQMMDDQSSCDTRTLSGHRGPVYSTSFSPDRSLLLSASEDATIRLWSLKTWTPLMVIKGHNFPVWDVEFSSHGHYFVSGGHDRTARLWATDHHQPLRIFSGHLSDVDSVSYHPNSNYIATGSSDRSVRVWDLLSGECVRYFTGHKGAVHCVKFSPDGKYLSSAGADGLVLLWDLASGTLVSQMRGHTGTVHALCYSQDNNILATGGLDMTVRLYDVRQVYDDHNTEVDATVPSSIHVNSNPNILLRSYPTRSSSVLHLHCTRTNLILGCGPYISTS